MATSTAYVSPSAAIKTYLALLFTLLLHLRSIPSRTPSIHIFTTPKPFLGDDNATQLSAIASWRRLSPLPQITILTTPDTPIPQSLNLPTRQIDASFLEVPLLPSILASLQTKADITILTNSDIHLFQDLLPALSDLHKRYEDFLAVSARRDLSALPDDLFIHAWYTRRYGTLHSYGGVDLWAWPSSHPPPQTPHFLFGRGRYDNWLTHEAIATDRPVVDVTDAITLAHVTHDHHLVAGEDLDSNMEFWSRSGHFEAVINGYLAERHGSFEPQLGTVLHAPLKMVRCFEEGKVCTMKRRRPGNCRCEHSPFVEKAMADSYLVNGSRTVICGLLSRNFDEPQRKRFQISGRGRGPFGLPLTKEHVVKVIERRTGGKRVTLVVGEFEERDLVMEIVCGARVTGMFTELIIVALDETMYQFCVTRGLAVFLIDDIIDGKDMKHTRDLARLSSAYELVREGKRVLSVSAGVIIRESLWKHVGENAAVIVQPPVGGAIPDAIFFAGGNGSTEILQHAIELMRAGEGLGISLARASGTRVDLFDMDAFQAAEQCVDCQAAAVFMTEYERGAQEAVEAMNTNNMGLFGKKPQIVNATYVPPPRREPVGPSMDQAIHNSEIRTGSIEARIRAIDNDIVNFKREMQRSRPGTATFNMYKRRALQAMRQKKSLESRVAMNSNATFNLEQIRDTKYMQQDHVAMVGNLRAANEDLRENQTKIDLDEVEDLQDDLREAMQDAGEISELLGRSYDVDNVDEAELEAELEEFEEDSINYAAGEDLNVPSYLQPSAIHSQQTPQAANPNAANYAPPQGMPAQRY